MTTLTEVVALPKDLIAQVDAAVGSAEREAFISESVEAALRRRRLLEFLARKEPGWREEDHPELADGGVSWVRACVMSGKRVRRL